MEQDIKNLTEIIELSKEEIENNDENVTSILDLEDLKSLRNVLEDYILVKVSKEETEELLENSIPVSKIQDKIDELTKEYKQELEKNSIKAFILKCQIEVLKELLKGE